MSKQIPLHPLINPDSSYYDSGSKPSIQKFEEKYTVQKLINWAEITLAKYQDEGRANKGQQEADIIKAKTYENYYTMLRSLIIKEAEFADMIASEVYKKLNIHWRYK